MRPCFGLWIWRRGISIRFLWLFFGAVPIREELFSQQHDRWRIRVF